MGTSSSSSSSSNAKRHHHDAAVHHQPTGITVRSTRPRIYVCGMAGTGKTTLLHTLGVTPHTHDDDTRHDLFRRHPPRDGIWHDVTYYPVCHRSSSSSSSAAAAAASATTTVPMFMTVSDLVGNVTRYHDDHWCRVRDCDGIIYMMDGTTVADDCIADQRLELQRLLYYASRIMGHDHTTPPQPRFPPILVMLNKHDTLYHQCNGNDHDVHLFTMSFVFQVGLPPLPSDRALQHSRDHYHHTLAIILREYHPSWYDVLTHMIWSYIDDMIIPTPHELLSQLIHGRALPYHTPPPTLTISGVATSQQQQLHHLWESHVAMANTARASASVAASCSPPSCRDSGLLRLVSCSVHQRRGYDDGLQWLYQHALHRDDEPKASHAAVTSSSSLLAKVISSIFYR